MSNFDYNVVMEETKAHSDNPTEWTNEALLKEFLWAVHNKVVHKLSSSFRLGKVTSELFDRLYKLTYQPHILEHLVEQQERLSTCLSTGNTTNRNIELRKIEDILEVKTAIPDVYLP